MSNLKIFKQTIRNTSRDETSITAYSVFKYILRRVLLCTVCSYTWSSGRHCNSFKSKKKKNYNFRLKYFVTLSNTGSSTDNEQFYKKHSKRCTSHTVFTVHSTVFHRFKSFLKCWLWSCLYKYTFTTITHLEYNFHVSHVSGFISDAVYDAVFKNSPFAFAPYRLTDKFKCSYFLNIMWWTERFF